METHVTAPPILGELRHTLSAIIFGNPLFLPQEQLLANHRIYECEDVRQLHCWLLNTTAAAARRRLTDLPTTSLAGHVV